jgi:pimeloyl-ACP methyl ester carboxylesterase
MKQKIVLLPGMDGTGELFADFIRALPDSYETKTVSYPTGVCLSNAELMPFVQSSVPMSEPFVLVAESFSTPLAIQFAATNPQNLRGLVLCAGFAKCPVQGWRRFFGSFLLPFIFRMRLPDFAAKFLLLGPKASPALLKAVRAAISSVKPDVLSARFRAVLNCDVRNELSRVGVPILYLQAKNDQLIAASCLEEIRQIKPQISVEEIFGPHLLFQREPGQTVDVFTRFVSQLHSGSSQLHCGRAGIGDGDL